MKDFSPISDSETVDDGIDSLVRQRESNDGASTPQAVMGTKELRLQRQFYPALPEPIEDEQVPSVDRTANIRGGTTRS